MQKVEEAKTENMTNMEAELNGVKEHLQKHEQKSNINEKSGNTDSKDIITSIQNSLQIQSSEIRQQIGNAIKDIQYSNSTLISQLLENSSIKNKASSTEPKQAGTIELRAATERKMNEIINLCNDSENEKHGRSTKDTEKRHDSKNRNNQGIKGTGSKVAEIAAACERKWIYIDNLLATTTTDQLKTYLEQNGMPPLSCEKLETRDPHKTFKVGIEPQYMDNIMKNEIWPLNVTVKPFILNWRRRNGNNFF